MDSLISPISSGNSSKQRATAIALAVLTPLGIATPAASPAGFSPSSGTIEDTSGTVELGVC